MERRTSAIARIFAALALIAAVVAVIAIVSGSLGEDGSTSTGQQNQAKNQSSKNQNKQQSNSKPKAKTYTVQSGDTLSGIAEKTGVSVEQLQRLNPEVDALTLGEGEKLKLR